MCCSIFYNRCCCCHLDLGRQGLAELLDTPSSQHPVWSVQAGKLCALVTLDRLVLRDRRAGTGPASVRVLNEN